MLFILTWTTPSFSLLFENPFQIPERSFPFTFVLLFFSHFIIFFFVFISMPSLLPPKGNSQLLPINSIFLRIHNFLLNSEKCGLYKRFKLLLCDVKVIKRLRFISPVKNVKWTYSAVPLKSAIFVHSFTRTTRFTTRGVVSYSGNWTSYSSRSLRTRKESREKAAVRGKDQRGAKGGKARGDEKRRSFG